MKIFFEKWLLDFYPRFKTTPHSQLPTFLLIVNNNNNRKES